MPIFKFGGQNLFLREFRVKLLKNSVKIYSELFDEVTKSIEATHIKLIAQIKKRYNETFTRALKIDLVNLL